MKTKYYYLKMWLLVLLVISASSLLTSLIAQDIKPWAESNKMLFTAITKTGTTGMINKSTDGGHSWQNVWNGSTDAKTGAHKLFGIASGNGVLVAVGQIILYSTDNGSSWNETSLYRITGDNAFSKNYLVSVAFSNGFFVACSPWHVIYSQNGKDWKFVRTGELSVAEETAAKNPSGLSLADIAKDPKLHGKRPSVGEFPPEVTPGIKQPNYILAAGNEFFVFGGFGNMEGIKLKINGNAIVKDKDLAFSGNGASGQSIQRASWDGKSTIVAVSKNYRTAYSSDRGETWKYLDNPRKNQGWVASYHNGMWVSASPFLDLFYSKNISSGWQLGSIKGQRSQPRDLIYANGRWIMAGNDNIIRASIDGINWKDISEKEYGPHVQAIVYHVAK